MKKALLLLLFVFSICTYAQPPGLLNPYTICDDGGNDGIATFNLVSTDPIGSLGLNPAVYTVAFYPSDIDASNNVNVITNPSAYTNVVPYAQTIGVRFLNTSTSEVNVSGMNLIVSPNATIPLFVPQSSICTGQTMQALPTTSTNGITGTWSPALNNTTSTTYTFTPDIGQCATAVSLTILVTPSPTANPGSLTNCNPSEVITYHLPDADTQITGGISGFSVSYYLTLADAQAGTNPVASPFTPTVNPGTQLLYARVDTASFTCHAISTLALNTLTCGTSCSPPTQLTASMITGTSALLGWTSNSAETTQWEIYLAPEGSPMPLPTSSGGFIVSVNPAFITGLIPGACYYYYVRSVCGFMTNSEWSAPSTICTFDCSYFGNCYDNLKLIAFLDSNNNGIKDPEENPFNYGHFTYGINNSGLPLYGYPYYGIHYIFDENPTNSYAIHFDIDSAYGPYYSSTTNVTAATVSTGSGTQNFYFPITQIQPFTDVEVTIVPSGIPVPGFAYGNLIHYKNNGTQPINSGTVTFQKSPLTSLSYVSESVATITSSGFDFAYSNLMPAEERTIYVSLQMPTIPTVNLGDLITNTATVTPLAGDAFITNNSYTLSKVVVGSYDPNDKSESHGGKIGLDTFTSNDYLYYTVQFENTGTANAQFIRVEDLLDAGLDESTFEMISASHTVNTKREGHQLTWHFYNINLPPTVNNPTSSHGYIHFKVKPKPGYTAGDIIPNTASIYFDYNPPIVTNTFNTQFFSTLSRPDFDKNGILLYPNPASSNVQISSTQNDTINTVSIYEVSGKAVKQLSGLNSTQVTVPTQDLAKGVYFVEITTATNTKQIKKLIIK